MIDGNRCSRLNAMVGGMTEVTQLLYEALNKENACTKQKETKNTEKDVQSCHLDSIEMSTLNDEIKSCVKSDVSDNQHEKDENVSNKRVEEKDIESTQKCEHASNNQQSSNSEVDSQSHFCPEENDFLRNVKLR